MGQLPLKLVTPHSIGRQSIEVSIPAMDDLASLQPRIARLNLQHFQPIIEEVFDEFGLDGQSLIIESLQIDLGNLSLEKLEEEAARKFREELYKQLGERISFSGSAQSAHKATLVSVRSELDLLQHLLLTGRAPTWARHVRILPLCDLMDNAIASQPKALSAMLRRIGNAKVPIRLVRQLNAGALYQLTKVMVPAHAAELLLLSGAIVEAYEKSPAKKPAPRYFGDLVWRLILTYTTIERGTEFNRRMFVESALRGIAQEAGIAFAATIEIVREGLVEIATQRPVARSLTSTLSQIVVRNDAPTRWLVGQHTDAAIQEFLQTGRLGVGDRQSLQSSAYGGIDSAIAVYLRKISPTSARLSLIRKSALSDHIVNCWTDALGASGLAVILASAVSRPEASDQLIAADSELAQSARKAGFSSDRIAVLMQQFWAFQFSSIERFMGKALSVEEIIAAFLQHDRQHSRGADRAKRSQLDHLLGQKRHVQRSRDTGETNVQPALHQLEDLILERPSSLESSWRGLSKELRTEVISSEWSNNSALRARIRRMSVWQFRSFLQSFGAAINHRRSLKAGVLFAAATEAAGRKYSLVNARMRGELQVFLVEDLLADRRVNRWQSGNAASYQLLSLFIDHALPKLTSPVGGGLSVGRLIKAKVPSAFLPRFLAICRRLAKRGGYATLTKALDNYQVGTGLRLPRKRSSRLAGGRGISPRRLSATTSANDDEISSPDSRGDSGQPDLNEHSPSDRIFVSEDTQKMTEASQESIYVENAGLALAGPFLNHLFTELGLIRGSESAGPATLTGEQFSRAVHLTQSLVDGSSDRAEHMLVLNKLICGGQVDDVVDASIVRTAEEEEMCDRLLRAMLANWPALSEGTSVAGLQETFLQRPGRLQFDGEKWSLTVERRTLDVLLDQVGWGFRTMNSPWQAHPIHVEW